MANDRDGIKRSAEPSSTGCVECLQTGAWWLHLRRCVECGHIGYCDNTPNQHATKHFEATGHPVTTSFESGEDWCYDYRTEEFFVGPPLAPPHPHLRDQPVPGPKGMVPAGCRICFTAE